MSSTSTKGTTSIRKALIHSEPTGSATASNVRGGSDDYAPTLVLDGSLDTYWAVDDSVRTASLELDLGTVVPSMAGPKRPEGRVPLEGIAEGFAKAMETEYKKTADIAARYAVPGADYVTDAEGVITSVTPNAAKSNCVPRVPTGTQSEVAGKHPVADTLAETSSSSVVPSTAKCLPSRSSGLISRGE